jgi:hypothetical protein
MSLMKDAAKLAEDQLKKDRAEMAKNNQKQMEDLAKIQPTPTIAELQKAMGYVAPKKAELKPEEKVEPKAEDKEAKPHHEKSGYVTREANPAHASPTHVSKK